MLLGIILTACDSEPEQRPEQSVSQQEQNSETIDTDTETANGSIVLSDELISRHNKAVALMGAFDYQQAAQSFTELLGIHPAWDFARVNLAIATLNRQQPGDEEQALSLAASVLDRSPDNKRALYISGILNFNQGNIEQATRYFARVNALDPEDAYAAYYHAQCLFQLEQHQPALKLFQSAISLDGYLRSAYYGAFQAYQRLGDREQALHMLTEYQRLEQNPRSRLAEIKYTRMGPYAAVMPVQRVASNNDSVQKKLPPGSLFAKGQQIQSLSEGMTSRARAIVLQDQRQHWLFVFDGQHLAVMDINTKAWFEPSSLPFLNTDQVTSISLGDIDNDGLTDLFLGRDGQDQLWLQSEQSWEQHDALAETKIDASTRSAKTIDSLMLDADHDGDLDLLVATDSRVLLLNNNGDLSFRELVDEQMPDWQSLMVTQLLAWDVDQDRDLDLMAVSTNSFSVQLNDRLWRYEPSGSLSGLQAESIQSVLIQDVDVDGIPEFFGVTEQGQIQTWRISSPTQRFELIEKFSTGIANVKQAWLRDFDGNGQPELLISSESNYAVISLTGEVIYSGENSQHAPGYGVLAVIESNDNINQGPELVLLNEGAMAILPAGKGRYPFVQLSFAGQEDPGQSMRSNMSGIGTEYILRSADLWSAGMLMRQHTGPGSGLGPVSIGLAGRSVADYVEIDWSDGVFQTESALSVDQHYHITETQRQLASCPVVFVHDGQRYQFVTDILGVGGIGFNTGNGVYSDPRPWERIVLPNELLDTDSSTIKVKITEPMEEIAYIDQVELWAVDVPPGYQMALNERLAIQGIAPDGLPKLYKQLHLPINAIRVDADGDSTNVLAEVVQTDLQAVDVGQLHRNLKGLLSEELIIEFEFDIGSTQMKSPALLIDGWVEYGYSQTSFAAWQSGETYDALSLDAQTPDGQWHSVVQSFGYPAGMPRASMLPLDFFTADITALRLRTNQQIYLDRVALVDLDQQAQYELQTVSVTSAKMITQGFPRRNDGDQFQPSYDDSVRAPFWDTRYPTGYYTRLGEMTELVIERDNALAIIGPGDALELTFEAPTEPPKPGWYRYWVLSTDGWAKDMDLYTLSGETVGPLPRVDDVVVDRADELHGIYNIRYQSGR